MKSNDFTYTFICPTKEHVRADHDYPSKTDYAWDDKSYENEIKSYQPDEALKITFVEAK